MPFSKKSINFLFQHSAIVSQLFHLQEQRNFLLQFVTKKEVDKFLNAGITNCDHVEKMISFIHYEDDNVLFDNLIDQLLKIHEENEQFIIAMKLACERDNNMEDKKDKILRQTEERKHDNKNMKMDKLIIRNMKEIVRDMKSLCEENQKLQHSQNDQQEINNLVNINRKLSEQLTKLNAEKERPTGERSMSQPIQSSNESYKVSDNGSNTDELSNESNNESDKESDNGSNIESNNESSNESDYESSQQVISKSVEMKQLRPDDSFKKAKFLFNKGEDCLSWDKFNKALDCFTQALEMRRRLISDDHVDIAANLNRIGDVYYVKNKPKETLESYTQSLQMYRRLYQGDHVDIANVLNKIGSTYFKNKQFKDSLECNTESNEMYQRLYNSDHDDLARTLHNIALVHEKNQEWRKALDYYTRCLEMNRRLHPGGGHDEVREASENVYRMKQRMK